jgi:hypothetical protein
MDYPLLFLARESGRSVSFIVDLRSQGLGWSVIFSRVGVPYDVLFVGIERDPGPPYGKAWGYWRKHPKRLRLSDDEICGLVKVQTAHHVSGLSAYEVARARGQGRSCASLVAERNHRPHHGGSPGNAQGYEGGAGHGKGGKGNRGHV